MWLEKVISKKIIFSCRLESWRSLTKIAGSGAEINVQNLHGLLFYPLKRRDTGRLCKTYLYCLVDPNLYIEDFVFFRYLLLKCKGKWHVCFVQLIKSLVFGNGVKEAVFERWLQPFTFSSKVSQFCKYFIEAKGRQSDMYEWIVTYLSTVRCCGSAMFWCRSRSVSYLIRFDSVL
jgi:hypothetical protein